MAQDNLFEEERTNKTTLLVNDTKYTSAQDEFKTNKGSRMNNNNHHHDDDVQIFLFFVR